MNAPEHRSPNDTPTIPDKLLAIWEGTDDDIGLRGRLEDVSPGTWMAVAVFSLLVIFAVVSSSGSSAPRAERMSSTEYGSSRVDHSGRTDAHAGGSRAGTSSGGGYGQGGVGGGSFPSQQERCDMELESAVRETSGLRILTFWQNAPSNCGPSNTRSY